MEKKLDLKFKGERRYLHGPDIFNEVCTWLTSVESELSDIDFSFHSLAKKQLKVITGVLPNGIKPVAVCAYKVNCFQKKAYIVEIDQLVLESYVYPEDELVRDMEVDTDARLVILRGDVAYSDIEVWVSMTKALHLKVFSNHKGKWLFVRGRFSQYAHYSTSTERSVVLRASFNYKLTKSDVLLDGVKVGEIYFSIV